MEKNSRPKLDPIGYWSEIKLEIIKEYAKAYTKILKSQEMFSFVYIDGFAGSGINISKTSGEIVPGSPLNALLIQPPFKEYFFIDLKGTKVNALKEQVGERGDVHIYQGDCNNILLSEVFPRVRFDQYRRGLFLLDPYGIHLNFDVIQTAGQMETIDLFLNFPTMDINRNVIRHRPEKVDKKDIERMNLFWGDESWRDAAYRKVQTLFGEEDERLTNEEIALAFQKRLKEVAGFKYVPNPLPMRNSKGAIVYYLFFASQKEVGMKIASYIFQKYNNFGAR